MNIEIKYFTDDMEPLTYIDGKSDWIDLRAAQDMTIAAGTYVAIPLGIGMKLPVGYEAHVVPRSSTFKNFGLLQTNSMGVIDETYCGDNDQWHFPAYATRDTVIHKNGFNMKSPISNPMSFWTEQDVLLYIRIRQDEYDSNLRDCNLEVKCSADKRRRKMARNYIKKHKRFEICSVYGDIVGSNGEKESLPKNVADMGVLDLDRPLLKTTGCDRTGCMFCGYGCHLEKPGNGRFERMKLTHPKQYDYIMRPREQGGLGYKEIIDWINEHGNFDIRY